MASGKDMSDTEVSKCILVINTLHDQISFKIR